MHEEDDQQLIYRDKYFSFHDLESLTNVCFQTNNYLNNFPQVFKPENRDFLFLLKYKNQIASFCSLYPYSFHYAGTRISAYCIGSVCTDPKFRKLGLAREALLLAEEKAKENSADFLFLFTDNNNLYAKLKYIQTGNSYLAIISSNNFIGQKNLNSLLSEYKKILNNLNINNINFNSENNLDQLSEYIKIQLWQFIVYHSSNSESILSYIEFCDILKIKNMKIYFLKKNKSILSVCFLHKGDDFKNVIHSSYYENISYVIILINKIILDQNKHEIIFFPGIFYKDFENIFEYISIPSMSIKSINEKKFPTHILQDLCIKNSLFISSLQGT